MKCKICDSHSDLAFKDVLLNKYNVSFFKCTNCGYLFSEEPYWLEEAYTSAITYSDTGIIVRNLQFSKICSVLFDLYFDRRGKFIDYAGGYGLFTRMMRDIGFEYYWTDKYCENLFAKGFEHVDNANTKYQAITAFEVFEHLTDPVYEVERMLGLGRNIVFSTELLPERIPDPGQWWYYNFIHGQHISFYTKKSLSILGQKFGLNFYSMKGIHLFTEKKMNETVLRILKKASLLFLFDLLKIRYKSKTFEDHLFIKKKE